MDPYQATIESWNQLAAQYRDRFMDMDLYNDTYDLFCHLIKKRDPRILEIACGPGNITQYIHVKRPSMIGLTRKQVPSASCLVLDCREITSLAGHFEGILCGFCIPYLAKEDVLKLMHDAVFLLHAEGSFYISCIEGLYEQSGFEYSSDKQTKLFVYYYDEQFLTDKLKESGLRLIKVFRKSYQKREGSLQTHLIFIAKKE